MLPPIFEVSEVNGWGCWNEADCVRAPIKTQIAVFIPQRSLLFPILQMYSIHRDPVNIGTVSSPAGNLTVISFFPPWKPASFQMALWRGLFFFFFFFSNTTHFNITLFMWNVIWFFEGTSFVYAGNSPSQQYWYIDTSGQAILCGRDCHLHCRVFNSISGLYSLDAPPIEAT